MSDEEFEMETGAQEVEVEEVEEEQEEEEEEVEEKKSSSSSKTKGKKDTKATAAKAKAEKKTPAKRKDAGSSSVGVAAKKAKGAVTDETQAKDMVRSYMKQQNRPYTVLVIFENLHQVIKKPLLQRVCEELVEEGALQFKDFKKVRLYMAKQNASDAPDPAELAKMEAEESQLRDQLSSAKSKNSKLSSTLHSLLNEPSDSELASQLSTLQNEIDTLNAKLARIKGDKHLVSKEGMNKVQRAFNDAFKAWKQRRRATKDMVDTIAGEEGNPKDVIERFRLEMDEDAGDDFKQWEPLVKEIKK